MEKHIQVFNNTDCRQYLTRDTMGAPRIMDAGCGIDRVKLTTSELSG